jgi:DNA polymerase III subunit epsilon
MDPRRYVICDIEATGLDADKEIIEIALITLQEGKVTDVYETLINPLKPLSGFIQEFTSISARSLEEAPKFYDVADAIRMRIEGNIFVSHNTDFDYQLLRRKYQEMGQELKLKTFCTLKVAKEEIPGLKNYNLDALCAFFGISISQRHRALGDAEATLGLFRELQGLRFRSTPRPLYLPHHEKILKNLASRAGVVLFKDATDTIIHVEACSNMHQRARELLEIKKENHYLLKQTEDLKAESTGLQLIAEFKKLHLRPFSPHWVIQIVIDKNGEKQFKLMPHRRGVAGVWYFKTYHEARKKLKSLKQELGIPSFVYREGKKSKEEILRHNQKIDLLSKEANFPCEDLIILGAGRTPQEVGMVLVRQGHVLGYGYTQGHPPELFTSPEKYLIHRFSRHLGADLASKRYIKELKHMRQKSDSWRALAQVS